MARIPKTYFAENGGPNSDKEQLPRLRSRQSLKDAHNSKFLHFLKNMKILLKTITILSYAKQNLKSISTLKTLLLIGKLHQFNFTTKTITFCVN
jgi:hypothetical protein